MSRDEGAFGFRWAIDAPTKMLSALLSRACSAFFGGASSTSNSAARSGRGSMSGLFLNNLRGVPIAATNASDSPMKSRSWAIFAR